MVCPTCFCSTIEDATDLRDTVAERTRKWDSCFTMDFSYLHGGSVRDETRTRYRQWLTHKFATWVDQFGTSGCVGCGRCITWCPVGIDVTVEAAAVGAGGLGELIFRGVASVDNRLVLAGAIPAALLALGCDGALGLLEHWFRVPAPSASADAAR